MSNRAWKSLRRDVIQCELCPRLIKHCQQIAKTKRRAYIDQEYWGKPVPNVGTLPARLLVVGLAPGAHGANRIGRMFSGDRSGDWLYEALHRYDFATQPTSSSLADALELRDCVITNVCRCAPPGNKPTTEELNTCSQYLDRTFALVRPEVIIALGQLAWKAVLKNLSTRLVLPKPLPKFSHNAIVSLDSHIQLLGSYHPSQQNTFTGRLTKPMFHRVFRRARRLLS